MKVNLFMFCYPVTLENFVKIYLWCSFVIAMLSQLLGILTFDWTYIQRQGQIKFYASLVSLVITYIALVQYYRLDKHYTIYQQIKGYIDIFIFILGSFFILFLSIVNFNISIILTLFVQFYYIHTYLFATKIQNTYYFQFALDQPQAQQQQNDPIQEPILQN